MSDFTIAEDNKSHSTLTALTTELRQGITQMIAESLEGVGLNAYGIKPGAYLMNGLTTWNLKIQDSKLGLGEVAQRIDSAFCSDITLVDVSQRTRNHLSVTLAVNLALAAECLLQ